MGGHRGEKASGCEGKLGVALESLQQGGLHPGLSRTHVCASPSGGVAVWTLGPSTAPRFAPNT